METSAQYEFGRVTRVSRLGIPAALLLAAGRKPWAACAAQIEFILGTGELLVLDAPRCWADEADLFALHSIPRRCSLVAPAPHDVSPTRNGRPPAEAPWA